MFRTQKSTFSQAFGLASALCLFPIGGAWGSSHWDDPTLAADTGPTSNAPLWATGEVTVIDQVRLDVDSVWLESCDGASTLLEGAQRLNPGAGDTLSLPAGEWCAVELELDGPLVVMGESRDGSPMHLTLQASTLSLPLSEPLLVGLDDGAQVELELLPESWDALAPARGAWVVGPSSRSHDALVDLLEGADSAG